MGREAFAKVRINLRMTLCIVFKEYFDGKTKKHDTKLNRFITTWDYIYNQERVKLLDQIIDAMRRKARYMREDRLESYKPMPDLDDVITQLKELQKRNWEKRLSVLKYHDPDLPPNQECQLPYASKTSEEIKLAKAEADKSSSDNSISRTLATSLVNNGSAPKLGTWKSPPTSTRWTRIIHQTPPRGP